MNMKVGRLALRLAVGGFFVGHGTQKLFGWFGGNGLDATASGFEKLGLRPGRAAAVVAGVAEAGGGLLLAAGLETPLAATALTATMLTAIERVHLKNGPWVTRGGYEYNVVLIASVLALAEAGPGKLSLDAVLGRPKTARAESVLAVGALGALATRALSARMPAARPDPGLPPERSVATERASAFSPRAGSAD
jgi:putative oxidoreductase